MNTYEFITPSDPITFLAENDKIAFVVAVILGNGKAGCERIDETGFLISIPSLLFFSKDADKEIADYLGVDIDSFIDNERDNICKSLDSFAYTTVATRKEFDDNVSTIETPIALAEFKHNHEDNERTSMSKWVSTAWKFAKLLSDAPKREVKAEEPIEIIEEPIVEVETPIDPNLVVSTAKMRGLDNMTGF